MTPFATEISNSISRYVTHKASSNILSDKKQLTKNLYEYMQKLYPLSVIDEANNFMCFSSLHHKSSSKKSVNSIEEWVEYVPVYLICDYSNAGKKIVFQDKKYIDLKSSFFENEVTRYTLHLDYQQSQLYLLQEDKDEARIRKSDEEFNNKMSSLRNDLQSHTDIKNGFVVFVSNNSFYWDTLSLVNIKSPLKGCTCNKLTLIPEEYKSAIDDTVCCQVVWKETRDKDIKCCIGTFDSFFDSEDYPCSIKLKAKSGSFSTKYNSLSIKNGIPKSKKNLTLQDLFYGMLKPERFVPSSKKTFDVWETDFLNDYSRLMMSPAVRRMKDKTQVFTMDDSDFVRTRLTHSLEVANIAKLIGLGVEHELSKQMMFGKNLFPNIKDKYIPQILEVAGLIHDIGNPPYGHFGEKTIQNYFRHPERMSKNVRKMFNSLTPQQKADFRNFDGNVQGLRVLCHLGLSSDCTSFNLNKVIIATMIKYPFSSIEGNVENTKDHRKSKFGYFFAEERSYENICTALNLKEGQRHPLAYILEAADDITYIGDDIEDGWKLGYISKNEIVDQIDKLGVEKTMAIFGTKWEELKIRLLSTNKITEENAMLSIRIRLQRFMLERIIDVFSKNIKAIIKNELDDDRQELFQYDDALMAIHDTFWKPLVQKCYDGIHMTQLKGERVLTSLLNVYLEAVADPDFIKWKECKDGKSEISLNNMSKSGMLFETISENYRDDLAPIGQYIPQDAYGRIMLVTDHIAGMTDTFAYSMYHELCVD